MDFPKSVPGVGLVNGKFIDEDPLAATPGSLIPSAWGNAVTQEILAVIVSAGLTPDEANTAQLVAAINKKVTDVALQFATQSEAEAGTNLTKVMSPGRVFQAIAKRAGSYGSSRVVTATSVLVVGAFHTINAAGVTAGLPALSGTVSGDSIAVTARFDTVIAANGAENINNPAASTSANSFTIRAGEQVQFISNGASAWAMTSYTKNPQYQEYTAFSSVTGSVAQVISPVPAPPAYVENQRFRVKFSANNLAGAASTLAYLGLATKSLKQYDASGVKVNAVFVANQRSDVEYDGTDFVVLNQLPVAIVDTRQSPRGQFSNLRGSTTGLSANYPYTIDQVTVASSTGAAVVLSGVSLTLNTAATASATVSGMVGGATVASTFYAVYLHYNPTTAAMVLTGDLNFTSPSAAPAAGFTHWARIGSFRTDSTANKYPLRVSQEDNYTTYIPLAGTNVAAALIMVSGAMGSVNATPTWGAVPIGAFVPTTASKIRIFVNSYAGPVIVAPNPSYSGLSIASVRGAPIMLSTPEGFTANQAVMGEFVIESPNLYYACTNANGGLMCMGYEDRL